MAKAKDKGCFYLPSDATEAEGLAQDARSLWRSRDERMQRDQWAYELRRAPAQKGEVRELVSDCAIQVDAADDLMSSVDMQINVATDEETEADVAQQAEDLVRYVWDEWRRRYARQGRPPLIVDMVHSLNLYGWLCPRLTLLSQKKDRQFPWSLELLDPRRLYMDRADGTPDLIAYYTEMTPRQIALRAATIETWTRARLRRVLGERDPDDTTDPLPVIQYHTDKETAISVQGEWLKPPTLHEYPFGNPVLVLMAGGTTFRGPVPGGDLTDAQWDITNWDERVGTSFIQTIRPIVEDHQKIADLTAMLLAETVNPPTIDKLRTTELKKPIAGVGAWATLTPDEGHEQHPPPAQGIQLGLQMRQERSNAVAQSGINPVLLGGGEAQAGFDRFLLSAAGARTLRKRMDTIELAMTLLLEYTLALYSKYGGPPVQYKTVDRSTGGTRLVRRLRPEQVKLDQIRIEVRFGEIGVPDLQGRAMVAAQLVREGLVSQQYALSEILRVQNPSQVMAESQRDQCWKIPQFVQLMALAEMAKNPSSPIAGAIAMELLPASAARLTELARPPQPPGPAPGQGPPGPPGGQLPPMPGSGMPSTPQPGLPPQIQPPPMANPAAGPNGVAPPGPMPPGAAMPALR